MGLGGIRSPCRTSHPRAVPRYPVEFDPDSRAQILAEARELREWSRRLAAYTRELVYAPVAHRPHVPPRPTHGAGAHGSADEAYGERLNPLYDRIRVLRQAMAGAMTRALVLQSQA